MNTVDPKKYGLHSRTILQEITHEHIAIVKKIKSRIIMKDGRKILEQAQKIKLLQPNTKVSLIISGPICSKTKAFLNEQKIDIYLV